MKRMQPVLFWIVTGLLCFELVYGALWDFNVLNKTYVYGILSHLGYPLYVAAILGVAKLIAFCILLPNGMRIAKEWAYTGTFILFTGAFLSHLMAGDTFAQSAFALLFALLTLASYGLRPVNRRIAFTQ